MRYKLDINGYVSAVFWGCYTGTCAEYTGEVPAGYNSLVEWSDNACINAYYIDANGNLVLDVEKERKLKAQYQKDDVENAPVTWLEFRNFKNSLANKRLTKKETGQIVSVFSFDRLGYSIKMTNIQKPYKEITLITHNHNMLELTPEQGTKSGISLELFELYNKNAEENILTMAINGIALEDVEFTISGSENNTIPLFSLMKDTNYYLREGHGVNKQIEYEFRCFDGEKRDVVYSGPGGIINLPENRKVTEVVIKIPKGFHTEIFFVPNLGRGTTPLSTIYRYEGDKLSLDISSYEDIDYILVEDGYIYVSNKGEASLAGVSTFDLLPNHNVSYIYTDQFCDLEVEYNENKSVLEEGEMEEVDYVVEYGTDGLWTWRKWNSGAAECWRDISWITGPWLPWGNDYYSDYSPETNYPFEFVEKPKVSASYEATEMDGWLVKSAGYKNTETAVSGYYIMRSAPGKENVKLTITVEAKGRWK